jgi:glycosyltransferase involved in cell wall biosynthesis
MNTAQSPKISVLLPVYNAEKYIKQAIDSILNQTFSDFEFIIINDGSTDNSLAVIKSITDKRIIIINQENKGLIASLNYGIDISKGEYIARMDADDIAFPNRFEEQVKLFTKNEKIGLCGSSTENFGAVSSQTIRSDNNQFLKSYLLFGPPFAHPSIMMKRSILIKNNIRYDGNFTHCEDFAMWSSMVAYCEFTNAVDVLVKYRVHPEQVTNQFSSTVFDAHYQICCQNLNLLFIDLPHEDFFAYIAKKEHSLGLAGVVKIYILIIESNKKINQYNEVQLIKAISLKVTEQLSNFYGFRGFLFILINYRFLLNGSKIILILKSSLYRSLINIYKRIFK